MLMSLTTIGLNHTTAPIAVRERLAISSDRLQDHLRWLLSATGIDEAALLSTCNRTEVICWSRDQQGSERVPDWIASVGQFAEAELHPYLYRLNETEAVQHLLRVASGMDSMILGENEILGQLKQAYRVAEQEQAVGKFLKRLFQHSFSTAKRVRSETAINDSPVSVAYAAVTLAERIFTRLSDQTAFLIGAGETIELAAKHLCGKNMRRIVVVNRSLDNAHSVAASVGAEVLALDHLSEHLAEADVIISSTASPIPIVGKGAIEKALRARKRKPMFIVDMAVPRDVEPEVSELDDVYLYSVDDLQNVVSDNLAARQNAARDAEHIIHECANEYLSWMRSQAELNHLRDLREHADNIRQQTLAKYQQLLASGKDADEVLEQLATSLTNRLMHAPTKELNAAARRGDELLLRQARKMFKLDDETP